MSAIVVGTVGELARPLVSRFLKLTLGSIGVFNGVIATSPIYALREGLPAADRNGLHSDQHLGFVSLLRWSPISVIAIKYATPVLHAGSGRADERQPRSGDLPACTALPHGQEAPA